MWDYVASYIYQKHKKMWGKAYVELEQSNLQLPSFSSFHFLDLKLVPIDSTLNPVSTWIPEKQPDLKT